MSSDHRNAAPAPGLARATGSDRRGQLGRLGEELACERLTALGLRIVARNWRRRARLARGTRPAGGSGGRGPGGARACGPPARAVPPARRARLRQLAAAYLAAVEHPACR